MNDTTNETPAGRRGFEFHTLGPRRARPGDHLSPVALRRVSPIRPGVDPVRILRPIVGGVLGGDDDVSVEIGELCERTSVALVPGFAHSRFHVAIRTVIRHWEQQTEAGT